MASNFNIIFVVVAGICTYCFPAVAQQAANPPLSDSGYLLSIDAVDFAAIMTEFEMTSSVAPYTGDNTATLNVTTGGGAQFYISLFNCENAEAATGCEQALLFTGLPNAGVSYDELNGFNSESDVSKAINLPGQQIVLFGTQIFFRGGVGRDNVKLISALFLNDMQRYIEGKAIAGTSVSMLLQKGAPEKTDNFGAGLGTEHVASQISTTPAETLSRAQSAAVANTFGAAFVTDSVVEIAQ